MMARLAVRYPGYGWEHNQGYATLDHRRAIRRMGLTPFHRRSFLALQRTLAGDQASLGLFGDEPSDDLLGERPAEGLEGRGEREALDLLEGLAPSELAGSAIG